MDKTRIELFELGLSLLQNPNDMSVNLLKTQVYHLKLSTGFIINTEKEVKNLIIFLNNYELN